jgi:hypothetical protein
MAHVNTRNVDVEKLRKIALLCCDPMCTDTIDRALKKNFVSKLSVKRIAKLCTDCDTVDALDALVIEDAPEVSQQEFLRASMGELEMGRANFCDRIGCSKRALDKWLLPSDSNDFRKMDESIWSLVNEVLEHEKLKKKYDRLAKKQGKSVKAG